MTDLQIADAMAYLAQKMSLKDVAYAVGVSEWEIAGLIGPCRKSRKEIAQ